MKLLHVTTFGKNHASVLIKKIKKERVPLLPTDLEGILDKTVIDKDGAAQKIRNLTY